MGRNYRDEPIVMMRPLCGRWMYDDGQFLAHEDRHQTNCDNCKLMLERRGDAGEDTV